MKTRRSWGNQDRLYRELSGKPEEEQPAVSSVRCWDCLRYPKGGRSRGGCSLWGGTVSGITEGRPCFEARDRKYVHCSECGKPCDIVHDLDMSECCYAKTEIEEADHD